MTLSEDYIKDELEGLIGGAGSFKQNLNPETIFFIQLQRCLKLQSYDDESPAFASAVNGLLAVSPVIVRDAVQSRESEYYGIYDRFDYEYLCGTALGTVNDPVTHRDFYGRDIPPKHIIEEISDPTTGETKTIDKGIDWSDPNIISPKLVKVPKTDFSLMLQIICEEAEYAKISWKTKPKARVQDIKTSKAVKTPSIIDTEENKDET